MDALKVYSAEWRRKIDLMTEANETFSNSMFFDDCMNKLIEDGHTSEYEDDNAGNSNGGYKQAYFRQRGLRLDGYEYLGDRSTLILYICHYVQDEDLSSLTQTEIDQFVRNTKRFYEKCFEFDYIRSLEETDDAYEAAELIFDPMKVIDQVGVVIVTNSLLSSRVKSVNITEENQFSNGSKKIQTTLDIWDVRRFYDNEMSGGDSEAIEINVVDEFGYGIPALPVHLESSSYRSFLCVIPGNLLASLYKKHGAKLLEANVRSFLLFKGKVNRGMKKTLQEEPEMFFAYNNGITATAEDFKTNSKGEIVYLKNLQIVNGGQTTAALCITKSKQDVEDLSKVFVQTKLSIVDKKTSEKIVPDIARYANTQNKVSDSDFFSNHPFHRKMQEKSRKILAPRVEGQLRETKWFYERSRGQYENERKKGKSNEEKAFLLEYPVHQKIDKLSLAKTAVIFYGHPHQAVKGQQAMFKFFADHIQSDWEKKRHKFDDNFFMKIIAKQIMFRDGRIIVMKQVSGNAIQPVLAYSLFMLENLSNIGVLRGIDLKKIWKNQKMSTIVESELEKIVDFVYGYFTLHTEGIENKTILTVSKNAGFFEGFKQKIESTSMKTFLSEEYKRTLLFGTELN